MDLLGWNSPLAIVGMFVSAMLAANWLMRAAAGRRLPAFDCYVCGRKQMDRAARQWRFCPYCGVPRDSRKLSDIPGRRSVLDTPLKR